MTSSEKQRKPKRARTEPWKHIYGKDRKYTARVDRLRQRIFEQGKPPTGAA